LPSVAGKVDGWFDWNRDGDWSDDGEYVLQGMDVVPGRDTLTVAIPEDAAEGFTFARFRYTTQGVDQPTGWAANGEVEDYLIRVLSKQVVASDLDSGDANPGDGICDDGTGQCTFRAAIQESNASNTPVVIDFTAFGKRAVTVRPTSALPIITQPVIIAGGGLLTIDGSQAGTGSHGLHITAPGSSVLGTVVTSFDGHGVLIETDNTTISGSTLVANGQAGVRVASGSGNRIHGGSIQGNGGLAIDLGDGQIVTNDADDSDSGPNDLQNHPEITLFTAENGRIVGTLTSRPSASYIISVYSSSGCFASGHGEGAQFLGEFVVQTNDSGIGMFDSSVQATAINATITTTATAPNGSTSGFSKCFDAVTTSIERNNEVSIPTGTTLHQNYPNPFNPVTSIEFSVSSREFVTLEVFDVLGKRVAELVNNWVEPGHYSVRFDASGIPSGTYVYVLNAGEYRHSRQLTLLK